MERGFTVLAEALSRRVADGYAVFIQSVYVDSVGREFAKAPLSRTIVVPEAKDAYHAYALAQVWHADFRQLVDLCSDAHIRPAIDEPDEFRIVLGRAVTR